MVKISMVLIAIAALAFVSAVSAPGGAAEDLIHRRAEPCAQHPHICANAPLGWEMLGRAGR